MEDIQEPGASVRHRVLKSKHQSDQASQLSSGTSDASNGSDSDSISGGKSTVSRLLVCSYNQSV